MASTKMEKPSLHRLKTPRTATFPANVHKSPFPSEFSKSHFPALNDIIKKEDDLKTPITPPQAYTEFLKALTPVLTSPLSAGVFSEKSSGKTTPTSQPSSASTSCYCTYDGNKTPNSALSSTIPPSPFVRPRSARTPTSMRRIRIPASSPAYSPTGSPQSSSTRSPYSPPEWSLDSGVRYFDRPRSGAVRPVSVRQVVTRTVTYKRTDLEPAPKGKKRKSENDQ